jgi:tetratricopeptide (TPR) repeat protein
VLTNLGNVSTHLRRFDEAREYHRRALAIQERVLGTEHPTVALTLNNLTNLGDALAGAGRHAGAIERYRRAAEIFEAEKGGDHSWLAYPLTGLGAALVETGDLKAAVEPLERALTIRDKEGLPKDLAAETRLVLGRALVASKIDEARGRRLAAEARAVFAAEGARRAEMTAEVDAWLAKSSHR